MPRNKKTKKLAMPKDPKEAIKFLLNHEFKHPQTEAVEILRSANLVMGVAEDNARTMTTKDGKQIIYIIADRPDQEKDKEE